MLQGAQTQLFLRFFISAWTDNDSKTLASMASAEHLQAPIGSSPRGAQQKILCSGTLYQYSIHNWVAAD